MKRHRYAILAFIFACASFIGIVVIFKDQPRLFADVYLVAHDVETNSSGSLCVLVGVTNRSSRTYGVGFASQTKPASGWASPSLIKHFNACPGETLDPSSGIEVLVPLPLTPGPWRVAVSCFDKNEKIPGGNLGRGWRFVRMRLNREHYVKIVTTREVSSKAGL